MNTNTKEVSAKQWITKDLIRAFGETTGDDQWIHARSEKPIAHGALLVSLAIAQLNSLWPSNVKTEYSATVVTAIRNVMFVRPIYGESFVDFTFHIEEHRQSSTYEVPFAIKIIDPASKTSRLAVSEVARKSWTRS